MDIAISGSVTMKIGIGRGKRMDNPGFAMGGRQVRSTALKLH